MCCSRRVRRLPCALFSLEFIADAASKIVDGVLGDPTADELIEPETKPSQRRRVASIDQDQRVSSIDAKSNGSAEVRQPLRPTAPPEEYFFVLAPGLRNVRPQPKRHPHLSTEPQRRTHARLRAAGFRLLQIFLGILLSHGKRTLAHSLGVDGCGRDDLPGGAFHAPDCRSAL